MFDLSTTLFDLWSSELSLDFTAHGNIIDVIPFEWFLFHHLSSLSHPCVSVRVMENEEGRKEYLVFPPSKSQCPASSQKGRKIPLKGNGRRIDYILYSDEGLQQDWKLVRFSRGLVF